MAPGDLAAAHLGTLTPPDGTARPAEARPGYMAPPDALTTAIAVTTAVDILDQPTITQAGEALRWVTDATRDAAGHSTPTNIESWGRNISTRLRAVYLAALDPSLRVTDQIRYRTAALVPCFPSTSASSDARRSRKIPSALWPEWSLLLCPVKSAYSRIMRPALAGSLLLFGSRIDLPDAAKLLGSATDDSNISRILQILRAGAHWPGILHALTRLAEHLDAHPVPIDYARRRGIDYDHLLPAAHWKQICRRTGAPLGREHRHQVVRNLLFQRISGMPEHLAPAAYVIKDTPRRTYLSEFTASLTPALAAALDDAARAFLHDQGIRGEPVAWHPPTSLMDGLDLPGPDPAAVDIELMHELVMAAQSNISTIAEQLGTSVEVLRHLLQRHPPPPPPLTSHQFRARGQAIAAAQAVLSREELTRLYCDERRSLGEIAEGFGLNRITLTRLANEYAIPLRRYRTARTVIDRTWFYEQYVHHHRSLADLAQEKAMSPANMRRWAKILGVPLRSRGESRPESAID
ncbi:LysR family transcriptional regulator [Kitasatospora aburaviensis]